MPKPTILRATKIDVIQSPFSKNHQSITNNLILPSCSSALLLPAGISLVLIGRQDEAAILFPRRQGKHHHPILHIALTFHQVIAHELNQSLVSLRVSNVYDLSSRIFLFKCAKPGSKAQLLVDSGFRCHLTSFTRTAASTPSQFVSRLRKYLKSRRITGVSQIGTDRVIEITFSDGQYRVFLEFFAAGNIILTDTDLTVLALLRQVSEGDQDVDVKLGSKYVLEAKQNFHGIPAVSQERIKETLEKQAAKFKSAQEIGGKKAKRHKGGSDLKKALSVGFPEFPPHLLDHVFTKNGLDPATQLEDVLTNADTITMVEVAMNDAGDIFRSFGSAGQNKGYIIAKVKEPKSEAQQDGADSQEHSTRETLLYDDFHPFRPAQFVDKPALRILEFDGFNKTVDEFYSSLESQKLESRLTEKEEAAKKKLDTAKTEHEKRLQGLQKVQELHIRKAQTIEANTHRVEEAVAAVNGLVGQGMDWVDIGKLIENEQKRNNIVAQTIKLPLKLYENTVTLLLDEPGVGDEESDEEADLTEEEQDSDDESSKPAKSAATTEKRLTIDIDLALSPWANARQYYDQKKTAAQKETKTIAASEKALKSMQKKTETDLKKGLKQEKAALRPARKQFWFEKFLHFISSDGYLVLGGKDAQQNEILYRKYLKKGDVYVHADLHGASSVIIKNNPQTPDAPIPPSTLSQAGNLSVCSSSAWDSKAVMAAWWVNADQVSKTAPTGEYLTTGGFIIRGQKNFLPPSQLLLGFACYWLVSEESRANHGRNRIMRTESMLDSEAEALAVDVKGLEIEYKEPSETEEKAAIPDLEDAADEGEKEVEEDNEAAEDDSENEPDASDREDGDRKQRSNPLQIDGHERDEDDEPEQEVKVDNEGDYGGSEKAASVQGEGTQPHTENESDDESGAEQEQEQENAITDQTTSDGPSKQPQNPPRSKQIQPKRGANTKAAKRRAAKYALQDEDDKALAMSLLGSTKAEQRKAAEEDAKAAREAKFEADRERRRAQHNKAAEAEKAKQEKLAKRAEQAKEGDGAAVDEESDDDNAETAAQERAEHMNIDRLVPTPEPGDELIAAIPVVAPWPALSRNKYKVKLQPGNMKKGKALREVIGVWSGLGTKGPKVVDEKNLDKERVWAREVELIKAWRVEEVVGVLPVKGVRVVQGGGIAGASGSGGKAKGSGSARGGKGGKKGR